MKMFLLLKFLSSLNLIDYIKAVLMLEKFKNQFNLSESNDVITASPSGASNFGGIEESAKRD